ncbi:MAG: alkaline phosphatase family protein [Flavobacteriales bacterium]
MKRRSFIKKTALTAAASFAVPYILPSGRLFAATGARKANHVVLCLFAGGVRSLESHKFSNGNFGNMMPYTFTGGVENLAGVDIGSALGLPSGQSLQEQGTLFSNMKMKNGPTGHYNGHATLMTGVYTDTNLNINANPQYPTVFELYRKHNSPSMSALNAWWVSNSLGPYPQLNYSTDPSYGAKYGANHIQPMSFIYSGYESIYTTGNSLLNSQSESISTLKGFCDNNFNRDFANNSGVVNTAQDKALLEAFIQNNFNKAITGQLNDPWGLGPDIYNGDMYTMYFAEEIIKEFQPELLVVNMQNVDAAHDDTTDYLNNLKRADYALAHLWQTIQNTPGMENTILIAAPEHGRNLETNGVVDSFGREGTDHTGDDMSREVFCMMLGHQTDAFVNSGLSVNADCETIDIVPTIANILGFDNDIPGQLSGRSLNEAFS